MTLRTSVDTPTAEGTALARGVSPSSPAELFGSFAGAAVVGAAAAALDHSGSWSAAEWQRWTANTLDAGAVDVTSAEWVKGVGLVVGPHDPRVTVTTKLDPAAVEVLGGGLIGHGLGTREGTVWRVEVSPGSIAVRRKDYAAAERTAERQLEMDWLARDLRQPGDLDKQQRRSRITSWSRKSRAKMRERLATLDYEPMIGDGSRSPAMVTLTYPADWLPVAPDSETCMAHLIALKKRYRRAWGHELVATWKREFQRRGAPHYHLLMVPPVGTAEVELIGRRAIYGPGRAPRKARGKDWCPTYDARPIGHEPAVTLDLAFKQWLSWTWADIVNHPDPVEKRAHQLAGTNVDLREGSRYTDPRRVASYFAKHGAYSAKDYQNEAPAEWLEDETAGIGRFWGVWGLSPAVATVEVTPDAADALRRTARRWQAATALREPSVPGRGSAPATATAPRWRSREVLNVETGELAIRWKKRNSTFRLRPMMSARSGFLCVNDGPHLALQLARYVEWAVVPDRPDGARRYVPTRLKPSRLP